jgi:hypothetical protein
VVFPAKLNFSDDTVTPPSPLAAGKVLQGHWGLVQGPLAQRAIAGELRRAA